MWLFKKNGPSGFSSSSTAEEVTAGIDASSLTAIVTGASSGIGAETARVLALRGVSVIMGVRSMDSAKRVKEEIVKQIPSAKIDAMELDLSSLASVRKFASAFNSSGRRLNLLILKNSPVSSLASNNAGVMATPFTLSKDNIELQFATNHLGHFLLTSLLLENMKKTAVESKKEGRIVVVASEAHRATYPNGIRFDKINDKTGYSSYLAYGQSKLSNILHANELSRRLKEEGANVTANSLHPGIIATNLFRHMTIISVPMVAGIVDAFGKLAFKNVQQGAATTCYLALHPQVKGISGEYFSDSNLAKPTAFGKDDALGKKLWDFSSDLVK
ncbi:Short-chain dehydrogenase TIC 32, chloroplastic [Linum grandiflorum]